MRGEVGSLGCACRPVVRSTALQCAIRLGTLDTRSVWSRYAFADTFGLQTDCAEEVFELHEGQWVRTGSAKDDEPVSILPLDAITFSLGDLWP